MTGCVSRQLDEIARLSTSVVPAWPFAAASPFRLHLGVHRDQPSRRKDRLDAESPSAPFAPLRLNPARDPADGERASKKNLQTMLDIPQAWRTLLLGIVAACAGWPSLTSVLGQETQMRDTKTDTHSAARPDEVSVSHVDLDLTVDFEQQRIDGIADLQLQQHRGVGSSLAGHAWLAHS